MLSFFLPVINVVLSMVELLEVIYESNDCSSNSRYEWHFSLWEWSCDEFLAGHEAICNDTGFDECSFEFDECISTQYFLTSELDGLGNSVIFPWCKESNATCDDGIPNGSEYGLDCGKYCDTFCPTDSSQRTKLSYHKFTENDCSGPSLSLEVHYIPAATTCASYLATVKLSCMDGGRYDTCNVTLDACLTTDYISDVWLKDESNSLEIQCEDYVSSPSIQEFIDPTCNDGRMNGNEAGVDCGGDCQEQCSADWQFSVKLTTWVFSTDDCSSDPVATLYIFIGPQTYCAEWLLNEENKCNDGGFEQCSFEFEECLSSEYLSSGSSIVWECQIDTEDSLIPNFGICSDNQCDGVYLPNYECSCVDGISGKPCYGYENEEHILTSGRDIPSDTCIYDGASYKKFQCTDNADFIVISSYTDQICSMEDEAEPPVAMKRDKCYFFMEDNVMISFDDSIEGTCVSLAYAEILDEYCVDMAEFSDVCRYSSTMCSCSELLGSTTCDVPYTAAVEFYPSERGCDLDRLTYDLRAISDPSCEHLITYYHTYGTVPENYCQCLGLIPEETASTIFNCQEENTSILTIWASCTRSSFTLVQRTITTEANEICRASCGLCGITPAPTAQPTAAPLQTEYPTLEPTECRDIAEFSDSCRYSSAMCTCSEVLSKTECGESYTSNEVFHLNEGDCNLEMLQYNLREVYAGSELMTSSCEYLISWFETSGEWPEPQGCDCIGVIPEETASVILNCEIWDSSLLYMWSNCSGNSWNEQRTITTDPDNICPASCGLCGLPEDVDSPTTAPTAEGTEPPQVGEGDEKSSSQQAGNWWIYLIIAVFCLILAVAVTMYIRANYICIKRADFVRITEMSLRLGVENNKY